MTTPSPAKQTPIMRQWLAAKSSHPDAILFFRLGDFYEMFHDDAVLASRLLGLTLTARNKGAPDEVPMAGVPHHAAAGYVAKLLAAGHKVAVCEQMADPAKTKGVVPREVVRVITPGLVTDAEQLDARENAWLAAVEPEETGGMGLALLDLSTGTLEAARASSIAELLAELARAAPKEVLVGEGIDGLAAAIRAATRAPAVRDDGAMDDPIGRVAQLLGHEEATRAARSLAPAALAAAARALRFAAACSPGVPLPVRRIGAWDTGATLLLDETAQRHLELVTSMQGDRRASLLAVVDRTATAGGARLLRKRLLAPLVDVAAIRRRHDEVDVFVTHAAAREEARAALAQIGDIERLAVRASLGEITPRELGVLRDTLAAVPTLVAAIARIPDPSSREALGISSSPIDLVSDLAERLARELVDRPPPLAKDGGIFREGVDPDLDEARELQKSGTKRLAELEARLRSETAAATLKVKYTRVFGWYIEVTGKYLDRVPKEWRRKQTVAGAERFTNDELDDLSDKILHAEERAEAREAALYRDLVAAVAKASPRLFRLAARLAEWDVASALADLAHRLDYVRPEIDDGLVLDLENARHPVVERLAAAGRFVPNDVLIDGEKERLWLVTGPNMAGKSTLMRQVALVVVLAQMGSYVPATRARIGVVDRILSRVGASDDVSRGESTFMVEMRETASILRAATTRSLVILDEIGRGTSTYDGLAIAWAVAEHLHDVARCRAMFATHYHELTEFAKTAKHATNVSVSARELGDDVVFLHKLQKGAASRSYGIAVAKLAGLPEDVLARARAILESLEGGAALAGGDHATLRGRKSDRAQLDLFAAGGAKPDDVKHPALETLRAVDPDRLTPLDALALVVKLKAMT